MFQTESFSTEPLDVVARGTLLCFCMQLCLAMVSKVRGGTVDSIP